MKIAIQGHSTRGKEVIKILESLGGRNNEYSGNHPELYYELHSNSIVAMCTKSDDYKYYTLEEFEKEFPFKIGDKVMFPVKIGWASGKVTGLTYRQDQLKYEVDVRISGYHYVESHKLQLYPMKEERNITLTLKKAKEWYNKGGELREIALQAFNEQELNSLPKSWEEFCEEFPIKNGECWIGSQDTIYSATITQDRKYKNWISSKRSAEAHLALIQLEQLRGCWRQGWEPDWNNGNQTKYCISYYREKFKISILCETRCFLSFPTMKMAEEFLKCFRDLIEQAGDLI